MKIVQSFWSRPYGSRDLFFLNSGGWPHPIFNYMSWALSCLRFKKFYRVELVTDKLGRELLIDTLELPYDKVSLELEELNYTHTKNLWALGKIYAFEIQEEPFIHADADVFIWDKFPNNIEQGALVAQQLEPNTYHDKAIKELYERLCYIPDTITSYYNKTGDTSQYNAGIIGGTDFRFFHEYARIAKKIVDYNYDSIKNVDFLSNKGAFPCFFEQYLFLCMAREKKINVEVLLDPMEADGHVFTELSEFHIAHKTKYIHLLGGYKFDYYKAKMVSYFLWKEYPYYYQKIITTVKDNF